MRDTLRAGASDARSSLRAIVRDPGLRGATVLVAAIGVGAGTALFTLADAVLFRPLPGVAADDELIALYTDDLDTPRIDYQGVSWPDFIAYREQAPGVALAAFLRMPMTIEGTPFPVRVIGDLVSRDYFTVLGTAPAAGRLPRILARRRELALRLAVGASPAALARPLLFEAPLLTAAAAACGVGVASLLLRGLAAYPTPFGVVLYRELAPDSRSWLFAIGVAACVSTAVAAGQGIRAACCRPIDALRTGPGNTESRASVRGRQVLIAGQVALSFVLLVAAGSLARSLHHLSRIDPGYDAERVLAAPFEVRGPSADAPPDRTLFADLLRRIRRVPGVESASIGGTGPLSRFRGTIDVAPTDGGEADRAPVIFRDVGPDYFATIGLTLLRGTAFGIDGTDPRAVVVNENLAARIWPGGDAVGRFLEIGGEAVPRRVAGVVGNAAHRDLRDRGEPYLYRQILNRGVARGTLLIRTRPGENRVASRIRPAVAGVSDRIVVLDVRTLRQEVRTHLSRQHLAAAAAIALGAVAVVLIAVGVFGLVSTIAARSRRELGIRRAFGAGREQVVLLVLRGVFPPSAIGAAAGAAIWWLWAGPILARELYGIDSEAPLIVACAAAGLLAVTAAAAMRPAFQAANVEPLDALRSD